MNNTSTLLPDGPCRVLLVEDEPGDIELIRFAFRITEGQTFHLQIVTSLKEAIRQLSEHEAEFDVVLLDLMLPDSHGIETLKTLRRHCADIPVVILTSVLHNKLIQDALQAGAQDYLVKGEEPRALRKAIHYAVLRHAFNQTARLSEAVFNITHTAIAVFDSHLRPKQRNQAFTMLMQSSYASLVTQTLDHVLDVLLSQGCWPDIQIQLEEEGCFEQEMTVHAPDEDLTLLMRMHRLDRPDGHLSNYIMMLDDITEKKKAEQKLEYQASHDALTGLPNRSLFYDRLQQSIVESRRYGQSFALLFIDLDGFKAVNDTWGHAVGDQVLQVCAERMLSDVRESDTVARLSGDEFAVLIKNSAVPAHINLVAKKLLDSLAAPILIDKISIAISASIGVSSFPLDATSPDDMLSQADSAMYEAKREGRNCVRWNQHPSTPA